MTEEEADALDEEISAADITLNPGTGGIFTRASLQAASSGVMTCPDPLLPTRPFSVTV